VVFSRHVFSIFLAICNQITLCITRLSFIIPVSFYLRHIYIDNDLLLNFLVLGAFEVMCLDLCFTLHVVILATNLDVLFELLEWAGWTTIVSQRGGSREKSCFMPMNL
jgi:hypothetical protein